MIIASLRRPVFLFFWATVASGVFTLGQARAFPAATESLVKVRGEAVVSGRGRAARTVAISHAEVNALHTLLQSLVGADKMQFVGKLLNQADAYVQTSRLITLDQGEETVRVEVEAYIRPDRLRADLASLMLPLLAKPPAVMVLIGEQAGGVTRLSGTEVSVAEMSFAEAFHSEGFETLDPFVLRARYTQPQLIDVLRAGSAKAARMARENRADVILMGSAHFSESRAGSWGGTVRVTATLNLTLINAETGKEVRALTSSASLYSGSVEDGRRQAVIDAGAKIIDEALVNTVLAVIANTNSGTVWLAIEGPGNRLRVQEVMTALKRLEGLTALEEMYPSPDVARFRCQYAGSMKDFIAHLTEESRYSDFSLDSRVVSGQEATLTLTLNGGPSPSAP